MTIILEFELGTWYPVASPVIRGTQIHTTPRWTKGWSISFSFKPLQGNTAHGNIFHNFVQHPEDPEDTRTLQSVLTIQELSGRSTRLIIRSYVDGDNDYSLKTDPLVHNQWYSILIKSEKMSNGNYKFSITIDNSVIHQIENTTPQAFENVKTYVSTPLFFEANGYLQNFRLLFKCNLNMHIVYKSF